MGQLGLWVLLRVGAHLLGRVFLLVWRGVCVLARLPASAHALRSPRGMLNGGGW